MLKLKVDLDRVSFVGVLLLALSFMVSTGAPAQTSQGFTGLVTDSSGAVIPNAKVIVHNEGTAVDKMVTTTGTWNWAVPFLDPGTYDVSVTVDKFKTVQSTGITLVTGQTAAVNLSLPIGSVTAPVPLGRAS